MTQPANDEEPFDGSDAARLALENRKQDVRILEIKSQRRIEALKIITTGIVVTLVPAIISYLIQSQEVEIERVKSEQSYLKDFAADALQEDLYKRYNFADYLATVALSEKSRERWITYRKKIRGLFDEEEQLRRRLVELRQKREEKLREKPPDEGFLNQNQKEVIEVENKLSQLRQNLKLVNAAVIAPSSEVFTEPYGGGQYDRFQVRGLNLEDQGNAIWRKSGGTLNATLEVDHDCPECGGAVNQIIVGIAGEDQAQACVWIGSQSSNGWQPSVFTLNVPSKPGTYKIRTRYAQAWTCDAALGWWKVDRPDGPTAESDIGVVVVTGTMSES